MGEMLTYLMYSLIGSRLIPLPDGKMHLHVLKWSQGRCLFFKEKLGGKLIISTKVM